MNFADHFVGPGTVGRIGSNGTADSEGAAALAAFGLEHVLAVEGFSFLFEPEEGFFFLKSGEKYGEMIAAVADDASTTGQTLGQMMSQ